MALTNTPKNTASITNTGKGDKDITWDEATFTWNQASGTWDTVLSAISNTPKNTGSINNIPKS